MTTNSIVANTEQSSKKANFTHQSNDGFSGIATDQSILLIENAQLLSSSFKKHLNANGFNAHNKERNETLEQSLIKKQIDMIMLDIGFSELPNLEIINTIRTLFKGPLVILTSRISEQEQIRAFQLGADEYIVKPVSDNILLVKILALFRFQNKAKIINAQTRIDFGELTLYPLSHKCKLNDKNITLTLFEFKLLRLLVDNVGKIMSRESIYSTLLGRKYNGVERTVDVRVSQLREKLTNENTSGIRIETVWGQGYMLSQLVKAPGNI